MGRSGVILDYSLYFFFFSLAALPAITQQHASQKFIWAMKDTDIQIFLSLLHSVIPSHSQG